MSSYIFKQLGTCNKTDIEADSQADAKVLAAKYFGCRASSCLHIRGNGHAQVYVGFNKVKSQRLAIKADDTKCAIQELAHATNSLLQDWEIIDSYTALEVSINDIQYETLS